LTVIAADTSSVSAYFSGDRGTDVELIDGALSQGTLCLPPVVLTEALSDPSSRVRLAPIISRWRLLDILPGYWLRASEIRSQLIAKGLRAKIPDTLIAQSCIDHDVPLITRDPDFRHFAKHCGLKLAQRISRSGF
jgi:predicted nucleic acid-binding protein